MRKVQRQNTVWTLAAVVVLLWIFSGPGYAEIKVDPSFPGGKQDDGRCIGEVRLIWDLTVPDSWVTTKPEPFWLFDFSSRLGPAPGTVRLGIWGQHVTDKCCGEEVDKKPGESISFVEPMLAFPKKGETISRAYGAIATHPTKKGAPHCDVYRSRIDLSWPKDKAAGSGKIYIHGSHIGWRPPFWWSFHNELDRNVKINVSASYPDGTWEQIVKDKELSKCQSDSGPIAPKKQDPPKEPLPATDFKIMVSGSSTSSTTLAFLGTIDGEPGMMPLGLLTDSFVGTGEFLAPAIWSEQQDLYIGVDLMQLLGLGGDTPLQDQYTFTDGVCDLLPGFLVGISPVTYSASGNQFVTENPYSGIGLNAGPIDGKVPEPATIMLLGLGGLALLRRRR